jgi:hypothetical protein
MPAVKKVGFVDVISPTNDELIRIHRFMDTVIKRFSTRDFINLEPL